MRDETGESAGTAGGSGLMGWVYLLIAGLLELGWPVSVKYAWTDEGLRLRPAAFAAFCMIASGGMLLLAQRTLPIGTAYSVWTGIGAVGTAVLGIALFKEPATPARLLFLGLIVVGIIGLKYTSGPDQ